MAIYMDVHSGMQGISSDDLVAAHQKDLDAEHTEDVHFSKVWADPKSGKVFCLAEGPSMDAVRRVHERAGHPADELYECSLTVE